MFEILALLVLLAWIVCSIWFAARIARVARYGALKALIFIVLASVFAVLPLVDEIIGKIQFDRLCKEAEEVKIYGTIPVGTDLYYSDGRWRLGGNIALPFEEFKQVRATYDSLVVWESAQVARESEAIPIAESETRIVNRKTIMLLASFRSYSTRGGWLSRNFEKPALVRDQCLPPTFRNIDQRILPFKGSVDVQK